MATTSLPLMTHNDYTVAILCAMDLERNAVRYMLDEEHRRLPIKPGDSNSYTLGVLQGHNVVLACLPGQQGKGSAATVATNLSRSFPSIKWRFFVGIGGGVPSDEHDIRLGDVVISMPSGEYGGVVQYDLGRGTDSGIQLKGFLWPPPSLLRNAAQDMRSDHVLQPNKIEEYLQVMLKRGPRLAIYGRPSKPDVFFDEIYPHPPNARDCTGQCDLAYAADRPARMETAPEIHYGLIASGDMVIKSAKIRDNIALHAGRNALCFEMEAAGLMTEYSAMVIRGISDYADSHKNSSWQHYAAATAAACAKELLSYVNPETARTTEPGTPSAVGGAPQSATLIGRGVQNLGGTLSVGRNLNIQ